MALRNILLWMSLAPAVLSLTAEHAITSKSVSKTASRAVAAATTTAAQDPILPGTACNCVKYYDVAKDDGCWAIAHANNISTDQFFSYNPSLKTDCSNLVPNTRVCVGISGPKPSFCSTSTSTSTSTTSTSISVGTFTPIGATTSSSWVPKTKNTTTTTGGVPTPTQSGLASNRFYQTGQFDNCKTIVAFYSTWVTIEDFIDMNPAVGKNCTGILAGYYVCVGRPRPSNTTTASQIPLSTWDPPTGDTATPVLTPSPVQSGVITNCAAFYEASSTDNCNSIASMYTLPIPELEQWNPALGSNCSGIVAGDYYCINDGHQATTIPIVTTAPSPTQTRIASNCISWYKAGGGDDCDTISFTFDTFNASDFIAWNPAVGQDCSNVVEGDYYCIAVPGFPTSRTAPFSFPTAAPTGGNSTGPPGPVQSGTTAKCTSWWYVGLSDTCDMIAQYQGITKQQLITWNPALKSDCSGLQPDYYICVGDGTLSPGTVSAGPPAGPTSNSTTSKKAGATIAQRWIQPLTTTGF